jgi:hypothetical protein
VRVRGVPERVIEKIPLIRLRHLLPVPGEKDSRWLGVLLLFAGVDRLETT